MAYYRRRNFGAYRKRRPRRRTYKKKYSGFKRTGSKDNQQKGSAFSKFRKTGTNVRVSRMFKQKVAKAIGNRLSGVDDTNLVIDVNATPTAGEFDRGVCDTWFDSMTAIHASDATDNETLFHGRNIKMKAVRIRTWLHAIYDNQNVPGSDADQYYAGPVHLKFYFFLCKDHSITTQYAVPAEFKTNTWFNMGRYNEKYMYKSNHEQQMIPLGATGENPNEVYYDEADLTNVFRDPRYVQFLCQKEVIIEPLRSHEAKSETFIKEGQCKEIDWYIPINKTTQFISGNPEKWNLCCAVYDVSRMHQGIMTTGTPGTFNRDFLEPAKYVGVTDEDQKSMMLATDGTTVTGANHGTITFMVRRYWENLMG